MCFKNLIKVKNRYFSTVFDHNVLRHEGFRERELWSSLITNNITQNFITWDLKNPNAPTKSLLVYATITICTQLKDKPLNYLLKYILYYIKM